MSEPTQPLHPPAGPPYGTPTRPIPNHWAPAPPEAQPAPEPNRIAAWFVLGAGAAAVLGSFLPWASITAPFIGTMSINGTDGDGLITAALGVLLLGYGALALRGRPATPLGVLGALLGAAITGIAAWDIAGLQTKVAELRTQMTAEAGQDDFGIGAAMADAVHVSVGIGLWLLVIAGAVGTVSAILTLKRRA